ncbi:hypothetical protein Tco_0617231 [Tanacetum coccineum]
MASLITSNDDAAVAQRRLENKQLKERTNTDCLVKEQEKVHLGIKVGAGITVTGVPVQEGPEGNVAGRKKMRSKEVKLRNLLKYKAWLTRRSSVRDTIVPSECPELLSKDNRNFMFAENDEEMSFLPHSGGSPIREEMPVIGSGSIAERMKNRKCKTKGSMKPYVKRKLVNVGSSSRSTRQKSSPAKAEFSAFLTIFYDDGKDGNGYLITYYYT